MLLSYGKPGHISFPILLQCQRLATQGNHITSLYQLLQRATGTLMREYLQHCKAARFLDVPALNQYLTRGGEKTLDLPLQARIDHHSGPSAARTSEPRRRSEQTANQRAFRINLATLAAKVRTAEFGQRRLMFRVALDGKPRDFFAGSSHWTAAVVATRDTPERWNTPAKKLDLLIVAGHAVISLRSNNATTR